jgi:hypothetical protein
MSLPSFETNPNEASDKKKVSEHILTSKHVEIQKTPEIMYYIGIY